MESIPSRIATRGTVAIRPTSVGRHLQLRAAKLPFATGECPFVWFEMPICPGRGLLTDGTCPMVAPWRAARLVGRALLRKAT